MGILYTRGADLATGDGLHGQETVYTMSLHRMHGARRRSLLGFPRWGSCHGCAVTDEVTAVNHRDPRMSTVSFKCIPCFFTGWEKAAASVGQGLAPADAARMPRHGGKLIASPMKTRNISVPL